MRKALSAATLASAAAISLMVPSSAEAAPNSTRGAIADFLGGKIDLSEGWGGAQACVVFSPSDVRCYTTSEEANSATALKGDQDGGSSTSGTANCPAGWLCIYADPNWDGRRLQFSSEYWMNLAPYGFERQTSSWHNNQNCSWWQPKNDNGTLGNGSGWDLAMPACAQSSSIGPYDNVAVDIHG